MKGLKGSMCIAPMAANPSLATPLGKPMQEVEIDTPTNSSDGGCVSNASDFLSMRFECIVSWKSSGEELGI